jgi:hypothetical protein
MSWKKLLWIIPLIFVLLGSGMWLGWRLLTIDSMETSVDTRPSVTKGSEDSTREIVNTPVSETIVVFNDIDSPYKNGHDFIGQIHSFYNETLGWGGIGTASYSEQKEKAEFIIETINQIQEVKNEELKRDFEEIKVLAERVVEKDDRKAMRSLHRYFHDLDIYFNGYDYHQTFQVTSFNGV